jgi:hypothetical protein
MKPKIYTILNNAIEEGCRYGVSRAFKHDDDPSSDSIEREVHKAIMDAMNEVFEFESYTYELY